MSNKTFYLTKLEEMEAREAPMPVMGPDDVTIKIQSVGVCGSDLHYYSKGSIGNFIGEFPRVSERKELDQISQIPHPMEFAMYYDL